MGLRSRKRGDCRACCAADLQCTLAGSSAALSVAVGVWCDRAEKSALISQRLPLPLHLSPPSRFPSLLACSLSRSLLSQGVSVPECSWSSLGNLDPEPVYTHTYTYTRAHTRAHMHTRWHTRTSVLPPPPPGDAAETFIYLKWMPRRDTSSLVFSRGHRHIGTREALCPVCNLTPFTAAAA